MTASPSDMSGPRMDALARLPVFFALQGRRVVVAGGHAAAAWKIELLAAAGARVDVYAASPSDDVRAADGREDVEGVLRAGQFGVGDRMVRGLPQAADELEGLPHRHHRVVRTMDHEERRGLFVDALQRRRREVVVTEMHRVLAHHVAGQQPFEPVLAVG